MIDSYDLKWIDSLPQDLKLSGFQIIQDLNVLKSKEKIEDSQFIIDLFLKFYNKLSFDFKKLLIYNYSDIMMEKLCYIEISLTSEETSFKPSHIDFLDSWYGCNETNINIEESKILAALFKVDWVRRMKGYRK